MKLEEILNLKEEIDNIFYDLADIADRITEEDFCEMEYKLIPYLKKLLYEKLEYY